MSKLNYQHYQPTISQKLTLAIAIAKKQIVITVDKEMNSTLYINDIRTFTELYNLKNKKILFPSLNRMGVITTIKEIKLGEPPC